MKSERPFFCFTNFGVLPALVVGLCSPFLVKGAEKGAAILDIGSRRELFVDHFLIDEMQDVRLMQHHPHDEGSVLKFDKPWEGLFCIYGTLIKDGTDVSSLAGKAVRLRFVMKDADLYAVRFAK